MTAVINNNINLLPASPAPAGVNTSTGSLGVSPGSVAASPNPAGLQSLPASPAPVATTTTATADVETKQAPTAAAAVPDPLSYLRSLGEAVSDGAKKSYGRYVSPLLASVVVRAVSLEKQVETKPKAAAAAAALKRAGGDQKAAEAPIRADDIPFPITNGPLSQQKENELVQLCVARCIEAHNPLTECLRLQVTFESSYASELHRLRSSHQKEESDTARALDGIVDIGNALTSPQAVANLYRAIFRLLLLNSGVDKPRIDKNVEREIAAALESVFPQAGLNAFQMMSPEDKRKQISELLPIVLGIRLFNREINKGGAGLTDIPVLCSDEVDALYESLEIESTEMGDLCHAYAGVLELEHERRGSIRASVSALAAELTNRRQYVLFVHQLQHECLDSIDIIRAARQTLREHMEQLKTLVGLRTSVPKDQVYPKFLNLATVWQQLTRERVKNQMRATLLRDMSEFKANFPSSLLEEDLQAAKELRASSALANAGAVPVPSVPGDPQQQKKKLEPDSFVKTLTQKEVETDEDQQLAATQAAASTGDVKQPPAAASSLASRTPLRLVKEQTPAFMSLPLQYQGYCPWTMTTRGGLLLPGNPHHGLIRYNARYYSFVSLTAMRDFVADPEKYLEGVVRQSHRVPALIHLLSLQEYVPLSDIAELIASASVDALVAQRSIAIAAAARSGKGGGHGTTLAGAMITKIDAWTQTNPKHIQYDAPDPNYDWNEWNLRRKAIQLANLMSKRTHGTQTALSHFRRDNETQYTLPLPRRDGTMPAKDTQTGISKGTNVARTTRYMGGLRGARGPTQLAVSSLTIEPIVTHGSNPPLNEQYKRWTTAGAAAGVATGTDVKSYHKSTASNSGAGAASRSTGTSTTGAASSSAASGNVMVSSTAAGNDEKYDPNDADADADDTEELAATAGQDDVDPEAELPPRATNNAGTDAATGDDDEYDDGGADEKDTNA